MRPLILELAPRRLRPTLYYRLYRDRRAEYPELFEDAPLEFAPAVRMNLHRDDEGHGNIAFAGFYELELTRRIAAQAEAGTLLVDVGANYGYFSLLWTSLNPRNRAVAFEASPRNARAIAQNIARNGCQDCIELHTTAVGKQPGRLRFSLGPEDQTGWGGFAANGDDGVEVEVVRLDEVFSDSVTIDVLKIDVEGADTWVLLGAERLLQRQQIQHIYFEANQERMRELGIGETEAADFLERLGCRVAALSGRANSRAEYYATAT